MTRPDSLIRLYPCLAFAWLCGVALTRWRNDDILLQGRVRRIGLNSALVCVALAATIFAVARHDVFGGILFMIAAVAIAIRTVPTVFSTFSKDRR